MSDDGQASANDCGKSGFTRIGDRSRPKQPSCRRDPTAAVRLIIPRIVFLIAVVRTVFIVVVVGDIIFLFSSPFFFSLRTPPSPHRQLWPTSIVARFIINFQSAIALLAIGAFSLGRGACTVFETGKFFCRKRKISIFLKTRFGFFLREIYLFIYLFSITLDDLRLFFGETTSSVDVARCVLVIGAEI